MSYKGASVILIILFYISFSLVLPLPNANVLLTIGPGFMIVQTGTNFTIQANISGNNIYGVQFDLYFNSTILEAINVTEGDFLKQHCTTTYSTPIINNTIGKITFANTCTGDNKADGSGVLCSITFKAKSTGLSNLNFDKVKILNNKLQELCVVFANGTVIVGLTNCIEFDLDNNTKIDIFDVVAGLEHLSYKKIIYNEDCSARNNNEIDLFDLLILIGKIAIEYS